MVGCCAIEVEGGVDSQGLW